VLVQRHGPEALDLFDRLAVGLRAVAGHAESAAQFLELGADGLNSRQPSPWQGG
jgi:hypothetical protein